MSQIHEPLRREIAALIELLVTEIVLIGRSRDYFCDIAVECRSCLKVWGLWNSGHYTGDASSQTSIDRRIRNIQDYIFHNDMSLTHLYNLTSYYTYKAWKKDPQLRERLGYEYYKIFIRDQNLLTKQLDNDYDYASKIFFNGVIRGWTTRDYEAFNKAV